MMIKNFSSSSEGLEEDERVTSKQTISRGGAKESNAPKIPKPKKVQPLSKVVTNKLPKQGSSS